ncbi:MAG: DUF1847 domain-containing protein [Clostridia bacterium]|nr:DUF1847 domain-containing protein [Clostridia bacterium]
MIVPLIVQLFFVFGHMFCKILTDLSSIIRHHGDMDCTKCVSKGCRTSSPCQDNKSDYLAEYQSDDIRSVTAAASSLVDNNRAGHLSRLQEIIEYMRGMGYRKIGVAYCYGMEKDAALLRAQLAAAGFVAHMVSCTVDRVLETEVDLSKSKPVVSCNPLGQAAQLNRLGVEFTLLMGLCLGHDILLQKNLAMDFTTFVVKDRVFRHNPLQALYDTSASTTE